MKKSEIFAVVSAFTFSATTLNTIVCQNVFAESITPVYEHFNKNDVNGKITVEIPENTSAEIKINFTSPEVTDEPYYITDADGGNSYSFDIEGRDTTDDDYRNYTLNVSITDSEYNDTAVYNETFTIPDGNDNPDSFKDITYTFTIDSEYSGNEWEILSETETNKNILLHLNSYLRGDVNGDNLIDAVDATQIQEYYAIVSTGGEGNFNERQKLSGDVNFDNLIDAVDATQVQQYYAELSTVGTATWIKPENQTTTSATNLTTKTTTTTTTSENTSSKQTTNTTTSENTSSKQTTNTTTTTTTENTSSKQTTNTTTTTEKTSSKQTANTTTTSENTSSKQTTTTTTTSSKQTTTTTTSAINNIDYSWYSDSIKTMSGEADNLLFHNYYLYDINKDGVYELIMEMGASEATNAYSIYTIKNNEMVFLGDISASHSVLCEDDGKLYKNNCHMGYQSINLIKFDGNEISETNTYEKEQSENYIDCGTAVQSYDWSNMTGINNIISDTKSTQTNNTTTTTTTTTTAPPTTTTTTTTDSSVTSYDSHGLVNDALNLRSAPDMNANVILVMPLNSSVTISGYTDEWYKVSYQSGGNTYYGYASRNYITDTANVDWRSAYKKKLASLTSEYDFITSDSAMYDLVDINGNGIPELIVSDGTAHASICKVYTYVSGGYTETTFSDISSGFAEYGTMGVDTENHVARSYYYGMGYEVTSFYRLEGTEFIHIASFSYDGSNYQYNSNTVTESQYNSYRSQYNYSFGTYGRKYTYTS